MKIILSIAAAVFALILAIDPAAASEAVRGAVSDCLESVVPSLFAFTVLAVYLQKSGLYRIALRPLAFPLSKLLRMDEELCCVFLLANVGGYPVGVKLLSELVRAGRLSNDDAGRMLCCCFGSGPAFVVGIAGLNVFKSAAAGLCLFGACFGSSLLMAAVVRARGEIKLAPSANGGRLDLTAGSFVGSVIGAARVMFTVCAMITAFSAITALLKTLGVYSAAEKLFGNAAVFPTLMEVTRIRYVSAVEYALPLCAALLSFGGVCVIMQIAALSDGIPLRKFIASRALAAALAALIAMPFSRLFLAAGTEVFAPSATVAAFNSSAPLSLCVLAMCAILLGGEKLSNIKRG